MSNEQKSEIAGKIEPYLQTLQKKIKKAKETAPGEAKQEIQQAVADFYSELEKHIPNYKKD